MIDSTCEMMALHGPLGAALDELVAVRDSDCRSVIWSAAAVQPYTSSRCLRRVASWLDDAPVGIAGSRRGLDNEHCSGAEVHP
jgi:hypothetical protein